MLEDVDELMPARPTTVRDPGTPDQFVMEQHSLTHFPSQPWWTRFTTSRTVENRRICASTSVQRRVHR